MSWHMVVVALQRAAPALLKGAIAAALLLLAAAELADRAAVDACLEVLGGPYGSWFRQSLPPLLLPRGL